ncbi:hypothetical protein B14911_02624 [Bacillus sp. NRRL B-14911]|uniref:Uncharacterized protein n=1 Tax=Bacillus infantis NRRL B-14911 TaxID=1367477 RepID=U5LGL0_9BACI|nr:hypothetical protein N288_23900 [Bacillus infantis NRRL B-14911]EAR68441.1 hypothetical protein B14911_02624 [Bacillus sp. NRRL B-14911]OXT15998.1 hypothetical protein B9K06_17650 [Bacillus sp. OG2]PLR73422.1 hypothetical protein CYJ37_07715 [Bacillus sp. UMB0728]
MLIDRKRNSYVLPGLDNPSIFLTAHKNSRFPDKIRSSLLTLAASRTEAMQTAVMRDSSASEIKLLLF